MFTNKSRRQLSVEESRAILNTDSELFDYLQKRECIPSGIDGETVQDLEDVGVL